MARFATHMGDPHGDPQTSPQADPHGLGAFLVKTIPEIHVDRRVVGWSAGRAMWITHVGGKLCHGLLEKSLKIGRTLRVILLKGVLLPSRCLLESPFSKAPSKNPSQNPSCKTPSKNPSFLSKSASVLDS